MNLSLYVLLIAAALGFFAFDQWGRRTARLRRARPREDQESFVAAFGDDAETRRIAGLVYAWLAEWAQEEVPVRPSDRLGMLKLSGSDLDDAVHQIAAQAGRAVPDKAPLAAPLAAIVTPGRLVEFIQALPPAPQASASGASMPGDSGPSTSVSDVP